MSPYRSGILRTCPNFETNPLDTNLSLGALGLAGESGEVVDLIKKVLHHKKPMDREKLLKELGDVRWYLEYLAMTLGVSMEEIEEMNLKKLEARYPNGFSYEAANAKRDEAQAQ